MKNEHILLTTLCNVWRFFLIGIANPWVYFVLIVYAHYYTTFPYIPYKVGAVLSAAGFNALYIGLMLRLACYISHPQKINLQDRFIALCEATYPVRAFMSVMLLMCVVLIGMGLILFREFFGSFSLIDFIRGLFGLSQTLAYSTICTIMEAMIIKKMIVFGLIILPYGSYFIYVFYREKIIDLLNKGLHK